METFAIFAAALAATTAFLIGARRIVGEFAAAARRQSQIDRLLHRELTDDGNGSLKSRIVRQGEQQAVQGAQLKQAQADVGHVQDTIDEQVDNFDKHSGDPHAHQPDN